MILLSIIILYLFTNTCVLLYDLYKAIVDLYKLRRIGKELRKELNKSSKFAKVTPLQRIKRVKVNRKVKNSSKKKQNVSLNNDLVIKNTSKKRIKFQNLKTNKFKRNT